MQRITLIGTGLTLASLVWGAVGCTSARQAAQPAVLITLDQVKKYETAVDDRIDAENAGYTSLRETLVTNARQLSYMDRKTQMFMAVQRFSDDAFDRKTVGRAALADYLIANDERFDTALIAQEDKEDQAKVQAQTAFLQLQLDRDALGRLETQLAAAVRKQSREEQLKAWVNFAVGVEKKYESLKKLDDARKKALTPATGPTTAP